jgi:hypothetical protein
MPGPGPKPRLAKASTVIMSSPSVTQKFVTPLAPKKAPASETVKNPEVEHPQYEGMDIETPTKDLEQTLLNAQESLEEGFVLEDLLKEEDVAHQTFVTYARSDSHLVSQIIAKIELMIQEDKRIPDDCIYRVEYGTVKNDESRFYFVVAFEEDHESAKHFASAEEVVIQVAERGVVKFPISQATKWVPTRTDGSVLFFVKKIPNSLNLRVVRKVLGEWTLGKAKRPFVKEVLSLEYLRHKTSKFLGEWLWNTSFRTTMTRSAQAFQEGFMSRSDAPQLKSPMEQMLILSWDATRTCASAVAGKAT